MWNLHAVLFVLLGIVALVLIPFALRIVYYIAGWLFLIVAGFFYSPDKDYEKPSGLSHSLLNFGYSLICSASRVRIHVKGVEQVPADEKFLFVSNHRSRFDNMVCALAMKRIKIAFVSKEENFRIPVGSRYMRRNCYICLKRGNSRSAFEMIKKSVEHIKGGVASVGIFPEGTRSKSGKVLPFKPGVFRIAEESLSPIVVGVTRNTEQIRLRWPWRATDVYFEVLKVYFPKDLNGKSTSQVAREIENLVRDALDGKSSAL